MYETPSHSATTPAPVSGTAPPARSFIEVAGLTAAYNGKVAVNGVSFTVAEGEHLSLLGPSGCGKSTLLRCIAGLEVPVSGTIRIAGETVFSSAEKINRPPDKRRLSMVFQSYAIWPHMSVFENVAYGARVRGVRGEALTQRVTSALEMIGMVEFAQRPATALSGGQQQRVALARAYAAEPRAILLDEPLSNLDARLRVRMREELRQLQRRVKLTAIYVTHDQEEAMAISDRIIIMRSGTIEQQGAAQEIYERPRTTFVADFIGAANIITGAVVQDAAGRQYLQAGDARIRCVARDVLPAPRPDGQHVLAVRPVHVEMAAATAACGENEWTATITSRLLLGDSVSYGVRWPGGTLRVVALPGASPAEGDLVKLRIPAERAVLVDWTWD